MYGFTGDIHNGHRVFIREDYEDANSGRSEEDRLGDLLGVYFTDLSRAVLYAEHHDPDLVYRKMDYDIDDRLRNHEAWENCWVPYRCGYIHTVTGEYVKGCKPMRDSWPCWAYKGASRYYSTNEQTSMHFGEKLSDMALGILTLAALFGGSSDDNEG